ncbi:MAG: HAD family hydrolase [Dehalococcoidia bacterium]|jgi:HAD superfamily hydrolase (TIGR01549 family)
MKQIELVSFDAEGTLVTPDFSETIWREAIPALYAQKKGLDLAQAKRCIAEEYNKIGAHRLEWYDIEYWFSCLDLGSSELVIQSCLNKIAHYPEVIEVLSSLASEYKLIVASGTPLELLHCLLRDVKPYFVRIFSSISHYRQVKSPDFYLNICEEMGVKPSQVIHVGDNWQFDFLNAREAGLNAFYIDRSGENHQESLSDLTQLKHFLMPSA